jgi:hypothetical protein
MGTRNLTAVIYKGEPRIAQYGQWDGYPQGQGYTILDFLLSADLSVFKDKIDTYVSFFDEKKDAKRLEKIDNTKDWDKKYPYMSRDMGGKILDFVYNLKKKIKLFNKYDFASDSLFCEYAYVIDLDKNTFEVYQGFNHQPLTKQDRFFSMTDEASIDKRSKDTGNDKYHPVKLLCSFNLKKLPKTHKGFITRLNKNIPSGDKFKFR